MKFSWFVTEKGRNFVFGGVCCLGLGTTSAYYLAHTFLLDKYKDAVQTYAVGVGVPVPKKVVALMDEVIDDMKINDRIRKLIKPFSVFGFNMFNAGSTKTVTGAVIGIPINFKYESIEDIDKNDITVNLEKVSWNKESGMLLLNALVLSKEAKKFAIGREIAHVQTFSPHFNTVYPLAVVILVYTISSNCNRRLNLYKAHFLNRGAFYAIVGLLGIGIWSFLKDYTTLYYEKYADEEMSSLGESYIKGGIEFYSKLLSRNVALRDLMGKKGEDSFSVNGNEEYLVRQYHLPLTYRKELLEKKLEELKADGSEHTTAVNINQTNNELVTGDNQTPA